MGRHVAVPLSKAGSAQKGGAELACLPWKDLMTLPLYSPGPDKGPRAREGRRLVCALRVVLKALVFHMVAQPGNWAVTKLEPQMAQ